jgi:hypothetical protein
VGDDWAITTAGVEYRPEPWPVLYPEEFPSFDSGGRSDREAYPRVADGIPQPDDRLVDRAAAYLPLREIATTPAG